MTDQPPWDAFGAQAPRQYQEQPQYPQQQHYGQQPYPPGQPPDGQRQGPHLRQAEGCYGQQSEPPRGPARGRRSRQSWARRHKVLTVIGSIFGAFILIGAIGAATSHSNRPAVPAAAVPTMAPAATQQVTTKAAARPKASRTAAARTSDAAGACDSRLDASGDIYVRMIAPGEPALAQELGGEWRWNNASHTCQTSVQLMIAAAPHTPGNCTQVGYVADNPGYDPNATPARPLKNVAAETGPAC